MNVIFRLLVLVVVYLIGGILFMKFYKKNEGSEVIPNRDFWADLPSKVKVSGRGRVFEVIMIFC